MEIQHGFTTFTETEMDNRPHHPHHPMWDRQVEVTKVYRFLNGKIGHWVGTVLVYQDTGQVIAVTCTCERGFPSVYVAQNLEDGVKFFTDMG